MAGYTECTAEWEFVFERDNPISLNPEALVYVKVLLDGKPVHESMAIIETKDDR